MKMLKICKLSISGLSNQVADLEEQKPLLIESLIILIYHQVYLNRKSLHVHDVYTHIACHMLNMTNVVTLANHCVRFTNNVRKSDTQKLTNVDVNF